MRRGEGPADRAAARRRPRSSSSSSGVALSRPLLPVDWFLLATATVARSGNFVPRGAGGRGGGLRRGRRLAAAPGDERLRQGDPGLRADDRVRAHGLRRRARGRSRARRGLARQRGDRGAARARCFCGRPIVVHLARRALARRGHRDRRRRARGGLGASRGASGGSGGGCGGCGDGPSRGSRSRVERGCHAEDPRGSPEARAAHRDRRASPSARCCRFWRSRTGSSRSCAATTTSRSPRTTASGRSRSRPRAATCSTATARSSSRTSRRTRCTSTGARRGTSRPPIDFIVEPARPGPRSRSRSRVERGRREPEFVPIPIAENLGIEEVAAGRGARDRASGVRDHGLAAAAVQARRRRPRTLSDTSRRPLPSRSRDPRGASTRSATGSGRRGSRAPTRGCSPAPTASGASSSTLTAARSAEANRLEASAGTEPVPDDRSQAPEGRGGVLPRAGRAPPSRMDPRTGEILALVSSPSYDPNWFTRRVTSTEWTGLIENPDRPLQNRAVQNMYSPGLGLQGLPRVRRARAGSGRSVRARVLSGPRHVLRPGVPVPQEGRATAGSTCAGRSRCRATSTSTTSAGSSGSTDQRDRDRASDSESPRASTSRSRSRGSCRPRSGRGQARLPLVSRARRSRSRSARARCS